MARYSVRTALTDKLWDVLREQLISNNVSVREYNYTLNRDTGANSKMQRPKLGWELGMALQLAGCNGIDLFIKAGYPLEEIYLEDTEQMLKKLKYIQECSDNILTDSFTRYCQILCPWAKEAKSISPADRVKLFVEHNPQEGATEYRLEFGGLAMDQVPQDRLAEYFIHNSVVVLSYSYALPLTILPEVARKLRVSPRWLLCMHDMSSFYGYDPQIEVIYDIYTLMDERSRGIFTKIVDGAYEMLLSYNSTDKSGG